MEGIVKGKVREFATAVRHKECDAQDEKGREISEALRLICDKIKRNEESFNLISDADLIEAIVYEGMALKARYRYLLRQAKSIGVCREPYKN
ncbi:MAG: DUF2508 family protein [Clostridiales bacterium]|nr:DUF2508 family protein [Clostridiales bacterium]